MGGRRVDEFFVDTTRSKTYMRLKKENPILWARVYNSSDSELYSGQDIVLVSGDESIDVTVSKNQESVPEDALVCLTFSLTDSREIEEYFISHEYNMNTT